MSPIPPAPCQFRRTPTKTAATIRLRHRLALETQCRTQNSNGS
jgi:hypothetical protein